MKKWLLRLAYAAAVLAPIAATADYLATPGGTTTVFAFVCVATKVCPAQVPIDSTGAEKATAGNPFRIDPTGTTNQPVTPSTAAAWGVGTSTQNSATVANGQLALAQFNTTPTGITTGNMSPIQLDANGNLLVNVKAGGAGGGAVTVANGADIAEGNTGDAAWTSGAGTTIGILKAIATNAAAALPTGSNVVGGVFGSPNVTPTDCSLAITTGGTAQNIIAASGAIHGFTLANIDAAAGSGEAVWFSVTGTAAATTIASYPLAPPAATTFAGYGSYTTPLGFGNNHAVSVVAATTGHKISCTFW